MTLSYIDVFAFRYGPALHAFARTLLGGDTCIAEDIVQETWIRAWQHPEAFREDLGSARGWLFTVARNLAMDSHRKRVRSAEIVTAIADRIPVTDSIDTLLEHHELYEALEKLRPEHREVITRLYLTDGTVDEVAQQLDIPPGTVKSRSHYALRHLATILRNKGIDSYQRYAH